MNSFYDIPRRSPANINSTNPVQQAAILDVPEVSMISGSSLINSPRYVKINDNHLSYNAWKYRNQTKCAPIVSAENPSIISKKQVRFQPSQKSVTSPKANILCHDNEEPKAPIKTLCDGIPFEQIYMSNIPNYVAPQPKCTVEKRFSPHNENYPSKFNCDIDQHNPTINLPTIDHYPSKMNCDIDQRNPRINLPTIDNYNVKGLQPELSDNLYKYKEINKENIEHQREPTVSDLMKIIQQQNEQLTKLQSQINELVLENRKKEEVAIAPRVLEDNRIFDNVLKPNRMPKYSFDVMTSFEVSIRAQKNYPQRLGKEHNTFPSKLAKENTSKIQEITEGSQLLRDQSISLSQPLTIQERPVSPERSVHVDMQDYSSDEEDSTSSIGASFYENVLGQVNNILQKKQVEKPAGTIKQVQEATFKHLQSLGVNVPIEEVYEVDGNDCGNSREISFAVKQILMKYLPDDMLTKVMTKNKLEPRKPEFSFATMQYLKKYNLLANGYGSTKTVSPNKREVKSSNRNMMSTKILDITALKQQPKLL